MTYVIRHRYDNSVVWFPTTTAGGDNVAPAIYTSMDEAQVSLHLAEAQERQIADEGWVDTPMEVYISVATKAEAKWLKQ